MLGERSVLLKRIIKTTANVQKFSNPVSCNPLLRNISSLFISARSINADFPRL